MYESLELGLSLIAPVELAVEVDTFTWDFASIRISPRPLPPFYEFDLLGRYAGEVFVRIKLVV